MKKINDRIFLLVGFMVIACSISMGFVVDARADLHGDSTKIEEAMLAKEQLTYPNEHTHDPGQHEHSPKELRAEFDDFPTLHPLVVHFPIVLLLLAALSQIGGWFVFRNELSWVTIFLVGAGFIGAYISGEYVHPHTHGLSDQVNRLLTEHEDYAEFTTWLAGLGFLIKVMSHFLFKRKWWSEAIVTATLVACAYTVSITGHYGAQLIHIEGVGARGEFLELETGAHDHVH